MESDYILKALKQYPMLRSGDLTLVAVSGGPDSVAMLHGLYKLSSELNISLHIAHLNHMIRGEESNIDEAFVRNLAHIYELPVTTKRVDVPAMRGELCMGEEETARLARYRFLQDTATELGAQRIATGHNADDRAESVLLNIIRGCGIDGLASIKPINDNIIRPLIETTREDIEHYIAANALPYRVDATNLDTTYARNRIRHELLPLLQDKYNPRIKEALLRLADIAAEQSDMVQTLGEGARQAVLREGILDAGLLADLPLALQAQVIRDEIRRVKGDLVDVTHEQVQDVIEGLRFAEDFTVNLPTGDLFVTRKGDLLRVWRREEPVSIEPFECAILMDGETRIEATGLTLKCEIVDNPQPAKLPLNEALIDLDSITGKLTARNPRPGDRIVPMGMAGSKKLQDVFVDKKVPKEQRARAVVVCDEEKILWVAGVVASGLGKVRPISRRAVHITLTPDR